MNLTQEEIDLLFDMTEKLTGTCQQGVYRKEVILSNIFRRMNQLEIHSLKDYLLKLDSDEKEWANFISAITIHTTFWFREWPHFEFLINHLQQWYKNNPNTCFNIWTAACSTGQEAYSLGLMLESFRRNHINFEYFIFGSDLDPISIEKSKNALYSKDDLSQIPKQFQNLLITTEGRFSLHKDILQRTAFFCHNLTDKITDLHKNIHMIFCRNVLIYFDPQSVVKVVENLIEKLDPKAGVLVLGHSENLPAHQYDMLSIGHSCYTKALPDPKLDKTENTHFDFTNLTEPPHFIMIGASTGGPEAICKLLENIPQPCPPIIIVQHISAHFSRAFAERVALHSGLNLNDSENHSLLAKNNLYFAFGDYHLNIEKHGHRLKLTHSNEPAFSGHRPCVEYLFSSAAKVKVPCAAFLLTGMGKDGSQGMLELKKSRFSFNCAQDSQSCVVYSMPKEAVKLGAVDYQGNISELKKCLHALITWQKYKKVNAA